MNSERDVRLTMTHQNQNTWLLAKRLLENNGLGAMYNARRAAANLLDAGYPGDSRDIVGIVHAMDLLLTDDISGTCH